MPSGPWKRTMIASLVLSLGSLPLLAEDPGTLPPLTGSGDHLPIPAPNPGNPSRLMPMYLDSGNSFTGTFSAPAHASYIGTFSGTGFRPGTSGPGPATIEFSGLANGSLPVGSIITLADLDAGSHPMEEITLQALDASMTELDTWLNEPFAGGSAGSPLETPAWDWDSVAKIYTFSGNTVPGNPSVGVYMKTNQEIHVLEVSRLTGGFGYAIDAPASIFCDGFEFGDTSPWNAPVP